MGARQGAGRAGRAGPRRQRRRVTLREVAEAAGTSLSTASRVLAGSGYAGAGARAQVQEAARRLGYVPDVPARSLKGQSSGLVGLLVSDLRNQFYALLAAGVEQALAAAGQQLLLVDDHGSGERAADAARAFVSMRADGVLLAPTGRAATELLVEHGTPVVEVDRRSGARGADSVVIDSGRGAREAVAHLLALGHRRIAMVVDETAWDTGRDRLRGYRAAHREAGVPVSRGLVVDIGLHPADPRGDVVAFLDRLPDVTAVFAANNVVAEVVWEALGQRGSRIPRDCSVVSFDDLAWMRMVEPGVTAVRQPVYEMGGRAAALLLERMAGTSGRSRRHLLEPELVVRGSTAAPRAA